MRFWIRRSLSSLLFFLSPRKRKRKGVSNAFNAFDPSPLSPLVSLLACMHACMHAFNPIPTLSLLSCLFSLACIEPNPIPAPTRGGGGGQPNPAPRPRPPPPRRRIHPRNTTSTQRRNATRRASVTDPPRRMRACASNCAIRRGARNRCTSTVGLCTLNQVDP
jgi:hypothetical protein